MGKHFYECHEDERDLKLDNNLDRCMDNFNLVVVASVRPPATIEEQTACQAQLDRIEADLQHR